MSIEFKGVFPALTTKFTDDDKLDFSLFEKNLQVQLAAGVNGIILGGTLGEASVLTTTEKEQLLKFTVEKCEGKVPVLLNIAEGSTKEALQQAAYAVAWGAKGLMILPPMRYKSDHRETVTYFKTVADATELPMMIYNNPVDYKIDVTLEMFAELTECKNIQAVKESTRDVTNVTRMRNSEYLPELKPGQKREDTQSIWLSTEILQKILSDNPTANGLRIYLGIADNYNVDGYQFHCRPEYIKQTTIIFVATNSPENPPTMQSSNNLLNSAKS